MCNIFSIFYFDDRLPPSIQVLSKMGLSPSPAELKAIIQEVDANGDGEVWGS